MEKEDVLALETRRRVYHAVRRRPGLHLRALERRTGVPLSTLRYHLRYLERHGLTVAREEGRYKRYYPVEGVSPRDRPVLAKLRREKPRRILLEVLIQGGTAWYEELRDALGYPESTLAHYLKELVEGGLLERQPVGRRSRYAAVEEERVLRLLVQYRESFVDAWVDRVLEVVEESPGLLEPGED